MKDFKERLEQEVGKLSNDKDKEGFKLGAEWVEGFYQKRDKDIWSRLDWLAEAMKCNGRECRSILNRLENFDDRVKPVVFE